MKTNGIKQKEVFNLLLRNDRNETMKQTEPTFSM